MPVHLLNEFIISLWCIYLSLPDENSLKVYRSMDVFFLHLGSPAPPQKSLRTVLAHAYKNKPLYF